jgi:hypothetical protein
MRRPCGARLVFGFDVFSGFVGDRWLQTKQAAILFGFCCCGVVAVTTFWFLDWTPLQANRQTTQFDWVLAQCGWGLFGVFASLSVFFLSGGMWRFWCKLDNSEPRKRKVWYWILLIGFCYGAIAYYLLIYLRTRTQRRIHPAVEHLS